MSLTAGEKCFIWLSGGQISEALVTRSILGEPLEVLHNGKRLAGEELDKAHPFEII